MKNAAYQYLQDHPGVVKEAYGQFQELLQRSSTDKDFRRQLLDDPRGAVAAFTGQSVPESYNIVFVENKADATIVLPDWVDSEAELSESELESVAGGFPTILVVGAAIVAGYQVGRLIEEIVD